MEKNNFPSISVLLPTLNAASVLGGCLKSISGQNYPKNKVEIIIADGGSADNTLKIAEKYSAKIYQNPLRTAEAGKAVALRQAQGELVALIDSDNILPDKNWLRQITAPFTNKNVIGSEPWEYTYRSNEGFIDRYCAMMGMNDPLCFFLGNYDRLNLLSGKWTGLDIDSTDKGDWIEVVLDDSKKIPTIGANGAVFRRDFLFSDNYKKDYFFDIDVLVEKVKNNPILFAKVKNGIVHLYCGNDVKKFIRKQKRRIKDYLFYKKKGTRVYPWQKQNSLGIVKFVLSCVLVFPLLFQTLKGYLKKKDIAWFFHPLACWITLIVYSQGRILSSFSNSEMNRKGWRQ